MPKNLVVCCDGTWNTPEQKQGGLPSPTNVVKLRNLCAQHEGQLVYYHPGVGTDGGLLDRLFGGGMGAGLGRNVQSAYEWLCRHYESGDRIFLFGFSRGAFTARSLGGFVTRCGLLDLSGLGEKAGWTRVSLLYQRGYRERRPSAGLGFEFLRGPLAEGAVDVHMIGVWDTVGALGIPDDMVLLDQLLDDPADYRFHDTGLSPRVRHARHAVAIDERRASFAPTLWTPGERPEDGSFSQLWFAGSHGDVGGGHLRSGLSDGALQWMVDEAVAVGLDVVEGLRGQIRPDARDVLHDSVDGVWQRLRTLPRATPPLLLDRVGVDLAEQAWQRHQLPPLSQAPYRPTRLLAAGQRVDVDVFARPHWNDSGIYLEAGVEYRFEASGEWLDAAIACGPGGARDGRFQLGELVHRIGDCIAWFESLYQRLTRKPGADWWGTRRCDAADWFELVAMIASQDGAATDGTSTEGECFAIGAGRRFTPQRPGYLYCYANDAWAFHGNNRGKVRLGIARD